MGRRDFESAVAAGIVTADQAARLAAFYGGPDAPPTDPAPGTTRFDLAHVLWYAGALIVMGAMGLFSTLAFAALGPGALVATALVYAGVFLACGHHLWHARGLPVPGGLLVAVAVAMTPLAVFGVQDGLGWWDAAGRPGAYRDAFVQIRGGWLPMEAATLAAALAAVRVYPFGFIAAAAAVALWFLSMDLAPWIAPWLTPGPAGAEPDWETRRAVSLWFGLGLIALAWRVDLRQRRADYAFWLHLAAVAAFWGGLTLRGGGGEAAALAYGGINLGLVALALFLSRPVYAVFGALGAAAYLGHLAWQVFADSLLFPFALSGVGLAVVGLGLVYRRHRARLADALDRALPEAVRRLRPRGPA